MNKELTLDALFENEDSASSYGKPKEDIRYAHPKKNYFVSQKTLFTVKFSSGQQLSVFASCTFNELAKTLNKTLKSDSFLMRIGYKNPYILNFWYFGRLIPFSATPKSFGLNPHDTIIATIFTK